MEEKILEVENLNIWFEEKNKKKEIVNEVSYTLYKKEILGIVGESGCGKSMSVNALIGLLPRGAFQSAKKMIYKNKDLMLCSAKERNSYRGKEMTMIFQEPMTSLNPLMKVGYQIQEMYMLHRPWTKEKCKEASLRSMEDVGLKNVERLYHSYPHELSGGMRQRIMIAIAMACEPGILIADEPTTALDVTTQAQILTLMKTLNQTKETSILFISHDLGVINEMCQRIMVMYLGYIVEEGTTNHILSSPRHPYTLGLIRSIPTIGKRKERLYAIPGKIPSMSERPKGCPFSTRCPYARDVCKTKLPELRSIEDGHRVRCFHPICEEATPYE